ncbi:hypothetical protein ACROYT_G015678 [Oculina patagonica]
MAQNSDSLGDVFEELYVEHNTTPAAKYTLTSSAKELFFKFSKPNEDDSQGAGANPNAFQQLLKRIEIVEMHQKSDIEDQVGHLSTYGQSHLLDFDKYTTMSMAESLVSNAKQVNQASFLAISSAEIQ